MTSAMRLPITSSWADREATCAIWVLPSTGCDISSTEPRSTSTPLSMPRFSAMGLAPAAMFLKPSWMIAWARTVAVVVPSPATSLVLDAASFSSWAPMFSNSSSSSISFAIVTPSEMTWGGPNFLSSTTLRPRGPRVTPTVSASLSMPRFIAARASSLYLICLANCSSSWQPAPGLGLAGVVLTLGLIYIVDLLYFLKRMSSSRTIRYSVSPSLYSVPAYFE